MFKLFFCIIIFTCLSVKADKLREPDPTLELQNLVFYTHSNIVSFTPSYQASLNEVGPKLNSSSTETQSSNTMYMQTPLSLTYGVSDELRIGISQTNLIQSTNNTTNINSGVITSNSSSGLSDPNFSLTWRAIKNLKKQFYVDVGFSSTPQETTHFAATAGQVGNNANSYSTASLTSSFFWFFGDEEVEIEPELKYDSSGISQGPTAATTTLYPNQFISGAVIFSERSHVNKNLYIQPGLTIDLPYTVSSINKNSGILTNTNYNTTFNPQVQFGYLLRSWCLLSFVVSYSTNSYASVTPTSANQTIDYNSSTTLSLRLLF